MSNTKFASITASLLARKGEAKPWVEPEQQSASWTSAISNALHELPPFAARPERPARPFARPFAAAKKLAAKTAAAAKVKKIAVRMSPHDYERLGIISVKKSTTRQHLLQEALQKLL